MELGGKDLAFVQSILGARVETALRGTAWATRWLCLVLCSFL